MAERGRERDAEVGEEDMRRLRGDALKKPHFGHTYSISHQSQVIRWRVIARGG